MEKVEEAKKRCKGVIERIGRLPPSTNISHSCKRSLLKLAHSELNFLSRFSSSNPINLPLSTNIGHLEAVLHILQQPFVTGVSRLCKPIRIAHHLLVHVDIVCTLNRNPVWVIVSDRNPNYICWDDGIGGRKSKGLRLRIKQVIDAATCSQTLKPFSVVLFFSNGLSSFLRDRLRDEFGATEFSSSSLLGFDFCEEIEDGWVNVLPRSFQEACVLEIKLGCSGNSVLSSKDSVVVDAMGSEIREEEDAEVVNPGDAFGALVSRMKGGVKEVESLLSERDDLINFDTTALIALVSGISNGCADELLALPELQLRQQFKGNVQFVIAQAMSEIQNPILVELSGIIAGKRCIICESVLSEFKELVAMYGGPNEKLRAGQLLKYFTVVHDGPSERMASLPTTRKLALKNKVLFGTGDRWHAPTLTANMAFVRAVSQIGMSLSTIEHRPRALTGD